MNYKEFWKFKQFEINFTLFKILIALKFCFILSIMEKIL